MATTEQKITALQQAIATSPEYAGIVPLFVGVYEYINGREGQTGISVALSGALTQTQKTENGLPLLNPSDLRFDRQQGVAFLRGVIQVLSAKGQENGAYLTLISDALENGAIDPKVIYCAILERNRTPIHELATRVAVPAPLLEYIFEIPLRTALEQFSETSAVSVFTGWQENFCPVCGSRAGMAELVGEEGRRMLSCSACAFTWQFKRLTCAYCGCDDPDKLAYFAAGEGATRVDTCKECSRYIKTRDSRKSVSEVPLEVEDLLTIHLDLLASREGFERGK